MAEQTTPNYGFSYYEQYDINWHTGLNNNFVNLDGVLDNLEADIKGVGGLNFLPQTLFLRDSDGDGVPELWQVAEDGCTVSTALEASQVMGFANKLTLRISNSTGSPRTVEVKNLVQVPPALDLCFSAWLYAPVLEAWLRVDDGVVPVEGVPAQYASAVRVEQAAHLSPSLSSVDFCLCITVPDGSVDEVVELHLPMVNTGDKGAAFVPSPGEMSALLSSELHLFGDLYHYGALKTNLDCNQKMLQNFRLQLLTSDPVSPVRGQLWFDDSGDKKRPRFYDGTNFLDLSVAKQCKSWYLAGGVTAGAEQGGGWIAPQGLTVETAYIYCKNPGTAGGTVVDVNINGISVFTDQGKRPSLAFDDADKKAVSGSPDISVLAEGDVLTIDVDQAATGAADLTVMLICR